MADILLVEDEANARQVLAMGLETRGHHVVATSGPAEAEEKLSGQHFDVVLTDLRMEGHDAGLDVVNMAARLRPKAQVLLLTAYASTDTAVQAMRDGAFDYLTKPVTAEELARAVERALEARDAPPADHTTADTSDKETLIGDSVIMQRVRERLFRAARRDFTVLITGESGTGKELAARYIHRYSTRADGPFVPVHCGAIPETLFESELFGHMKGAFTGADTDRVGLIEAADGGILFLDEVGEVPLSTQVKLLRVLQDMRVRRIGEKEERQVNVRVVAATNRDLSEEVNNGHFREDLFYRLNVVPVHMPPLRQRREDIPLLVEALLKRWGSKSMQVPEAIIRRLMDLPLLGNVRELENLLQRLLALSDDEALDARLLDDLYYGTPVTDLSLSALQRQKQNLDDVLEQAELRLISEAMQQTAGNATQAAKLLGISFRSMRYRLKKLGIREKD